MKHYYETEGESKRVRNMNDKRVSVALRDKKRHLSPRGESCSLLTRAGGGRRMREWLQTQLHEARAQGLKHADYTKSRESLGGHCIGPRVISCQIDLSFVFDPGTASEVEEKKKHFMLTSSRRNYILFFEEKPANKLWGWAWPKLRPAWWFAGLSWHPFCTAEKNWLKISRPDQLKCVQNHCKTS